MRKGHAVRVFRPSLCWKLLIVLGAGVCGTPGSLAVTPGFTINAGNVSVPGQGDAVENFTLTSLGGFTGTVNVECSGPNNSLLGDLVLPVCRPVATTVIPANGSVSGTVGFVPPWAANAASRSTTLPMIAGVLAGLGLLGLRLRTTAHRISILMIAAACLAPLAAITGCLGGSGLAMTPGTYEYTLTATSTSLTQTATFKVTVECNSCP